MPEDAWLIVGLGNPGPEYAKTRHNMGRRVVEELADRAGVRFARHRRAVADFAAGRLVGRRVTLLRSRGYMNESGGPVAAALRYEKLTPSQLIAIHDDLDLELGQIKVKCGGGDGGHNGLKSIGASLGTPDFYRVRIGIGRPPGQQDPAEYVLRPFTASQRADVPVVVARAADAVEMLVGEGLAGTQNEYHGR